MRTLMSVIDEGIHVVDREGVTVLYNAQAGQNDGLTPDEVMGKHLLQVFPSLTAATSTLLKVLTTGQPIVNQEQTFTNYKGSLVTTINSTFPLFDRGKMLGAIEVSKDVTRVRELSERVVGLQAELLLKRRRPAVPVGTARYTIDDLIGDHPRMKTVKERALKAARSDSAVLVFGETGTGKELLVHSIHHASERRNFPLVAQNCAALPEGLLESILFGTVRGSFTGAEDRPGLFELAEGGTLYLDEVNSMNLELQAKLLRVLQDGRFRRVGDTTERKANVRIIASSNEDPLAAVEQKRLRQDLYYRINVVYLELPAVRDRGSDIPLLTEHFLREHGLRLGVPGRRLAPAVERFFQSYAWPGNVRELEHAIEAALQMVTGAEITLHDLPAHLQRAAVMVEGTTCEDDGARGRLVTATIGGQGIRQNLFDLEREAVEKALKDSRWNLSLAARMLGCPRQTLQYRIKILGLRKPEAEGVTP